MTKNWDSDPTLLHKTTTATTEHKLEDKRTRVVKIGHSRKTATAKRRHLDELEIGIELGKMNSVSGRALASTTMGESTRTGNNHRERQTEVWLQAASRIGASELATDRSTGISVR
jgi:hypothetical protein